MPPANDPIDLDAVVARYRPIVGFRVKRALGPANPDWEDVADEIMTDVIAQVRSGAFAGRSSIGTFIYTIASRRIVDYIRLKTRVLRHAPEPEPEPDPSLRAEASEDVRALARALDRLKPRFREILYLAYFEELPREEIARRLGVSRRRVSERLNYAYKLLRGRIGEDFSNLPGPRPTKDKERDRR